MAGAGRQSDQGRPRKAAASKRVTRYDYSDVTEPRTPETGHTAMLGEEQVVVLPMDGQKWAAGLRLGELENDGQFPLVVDLDPAVDPVLLWSSKRNRKDIPVLPLQRNEIVAESRIGRIITRAREAAAREPTHEQGVLFADLEKQLREGDKDKRVEFYTHDEGWKNKLICGDSLPVIESLLEYEGLRGRVQMIYVDPPYGIKYDANFQQRIDRAENDQKDQADDVVTIKAFRDTWSLGVHSYLSYLAERLYLARELLADSGSVLVQMGLENVHLVRVVMDEVFGASNFLGQIAFLKSSGRGSTHLDSVYDILLWYGKDRGQVQYNQIYVPYTGGKQSHLYKNLELPDGTEIELTEAQLDGRETLPQGRRFKLDPLNSMGETEGGTFTYEFCGHPFQPPRGRHWSLTREGLDGLAAKRRLFSTGRQLRFKRFEDDLAFRPISDVWEDAQKGTYNPENDYVVQTAAKVVERCVLMTTKPGDLVFDPTCGSGTTAFAAEKWGRRWITCDTSRVAINVARRRLLSGVFEHYVPRGETPASGFSYETFNHNKPSTIAYDREPEKIDLVDRPTVATDCLRIVGPFEVLTLGRYSVEDWKGYVVGEGEDAGRLQNYIAVICRLYRRDAGLAPSGGLLHAVVDEGTRSLGISVGPISGRVTARQIHEAAKDAASAGVDEVHVLGWAFESNVNEIVEELQATVGVTVQAMMIRPDTLAEGLKVTQPETLFSPLAVPDVEMISEADGRHVVTLRGVAVFDRTRRTTEYKAAGSGYVAGWYLDEDYDGDCFVDCQMFFDFKKKPAIERALRIEVEPEEWTLRTSSDSFAAGGYGRIAVKVVDIFGNESTVVRTLD